MGQKPAYVPEDLLHHLYVTEELSQTEIAKRMGCSLAAVQRRMKKHGITPRTRAEAGIIHNGSVRRDFDEDLYTKAYLLGFCKGDVHPWIRDKNSPTIRLMTATTKREQIDLFHGLFAPYGRVYISAPDKRGAIHLAAYVNRSLSFLLDREDNIPNWVLTDIEAFYAFFAGYTDAEAHIGVHNGYAVFKLDSYDKNIIFQSYEIVRQAGIIGPIPFICTARGYRNKNGNRYHADLWRLQISAKSSLLLLLERIRPYLKHSKRIRDMEAALQNVRDRNSGQRPSELKEIKS